MTEKTIVRVLDLPEGQDWVWYPEANVVGVSSRLCAEEHARVLDELHAQWRRKWIKVVS